MQVSRGIETPIEEGVEKWSSTIEVSRRYRETTHQNQEQKLNRSTRCQEAIDDADPFSIDPPGIEKLSGLSKKKLKKLDRQQGIEEVSSQLLKPVFRDVKNTNMNSIQHAT